MTFGLRYLSLSLPLSYNTFFFSLTALPFISLSLSTQHVHADVDDFVYGTGTNTPENTRQRLTTNVFTVVFAYSFCRNDSHTVFNASSQPITMHNIGERDLRLNYNEKHSPSSSRATENGSAQFFINSIFFFVVVVVVCAYRRLRRLFYAGESVIV